MQRYLRILVAIWALCVWAVSFGAALTHEPTGMVFPDQLAGFERIEFTDYERENPGLGASYGYKTANGVVATIYVYTAGLSAVPADVTGPIFGQLRKQTLQEISQGAKHRNEFSEHTMGSILKVQSDKGKISVLFDGFKISGASGARNSFLWLWPAHGHFMKIRLSEAAGGEPDTRKVREFYESVVKLSVK